MKRYFCVLSLIATISILLNGACAAVLYRYAPSLFWIPLGLLLLVFMGSLLIALRFRKLFTMWMTRLIKRIDPRDRASMDAFPLPLIMLDETGRLLYSNALFNRQVMGGDPPIIDTPIERLFDCVSADDLSANHSVNLVRGKRKYTAQISVVRFDKNGRYILYLTDDTELKDTAEEYAASRPVVLQICIDNLDEATDRLRAADRARIVGTIETMLEDWISAEGGFLQKYGNDRFIAITEHRSLVTMRTERFSILDRVRKSFPEADGTITLSIGIGEEKTFSDCRASALRALDMALSRGGDQVAIKTPDGYDFFGGRSGGVEHRTRVRTRLISEALRELMLSSDRVLVMGHRMSDLDCIGSGVALATVAAHLGVSGAVVVNRNATMAAQLIERFPKTLFLDPDTARKLISRKTLLIIVDTHTADMLESPELYDLADRIVVIDHHRRKVNYIDNTVLTYHEPNSSSTCELITELLPYLSDNHYGRDVAEALLSGIMLDTRNFVLRTGVRTFEAAAYLRGLGADTVTVKKLFAESLETYRRKSDLIAVAQTYKRTVIAVRDDDYSDYRTSAAQAADDLLTVDDAIASFVVTRMGHQIQISARSYGECNVQLIMESMGGGGHLTMAATQLNHTSIDEAVVYLKAAIDTYFEKQSN